MNQSISRSSFLDVCGKKNKSQTKKTPPQGLYNLLQKFHSIKITLECIRISQVLFLVIS